MQHLERKDLGLIAAVAGALAWALTIVASPVLAAQSGALVGVVYAIGSVVCHQLPDRSFHLAGIQLPVCARCAGLYIGAAAGLVVWAFRARGPSRPWPRRHALATLAVAAVPTAVTVASALAGTGDPANVWRAGLAMPLGMAGGAVLGAAVSDHLK
ncbi:MAG TPA: DUF2085 domain-containing protein [Vicinamibacterales bacterium]|nr:DUF2085 domain-containing protein [Vicinamibacterales bacterium]